MSSFIQKLIHSRVAQGLLVTSLFLVGTFAVTNGATASLTTKSSPAVTASLPPIKHVWFIILENKSYDATFSGLNNNTYLWQTLPSQGVLLKNYYGTGHYSQDNYMALASGQAPIVDHQADCPTYKDLTGSVITDKKDPNYGQFKATGQNLANPFASGAGCVYPASVPTLFNQLSAAGVTWKAYAQDLGNPDASGAAHSAGGCGGPSLNPTTTPVANPGSANATDQYVAKHFPLPWFHSIIDDPANCSSKHVANLFDSTNGLYADLQSEDTTPQFSWISPNNCSDAHDAVCKGNNLSGGWADANTPNKPLNYTGGLYAADLFLEHVIPMIEASPAFKDNGLIDISFDEGFPAFTFTGNSFQNSTVDPATVASSLAADSAGENIFGKNVGYEPTGPNTPLMTDAKGNQLLPGPGFNAFVDRDSTIPGIVMGGAGTAPAARTDKVTGDSTSPYIVDQAIQATDVGRAVSGDGIPDGATVGAVYDLPDWAASPTGFAYRGSFELYVNGVPTAPTAAITSLTLAARTTATDPLFDATHPTTGGGDVGAVLISKFINPGTTSTTYYNHYSWLRSMEDIFQVAQSSPGLDKKGHIGFAAQPGLAAFGHDVFNGSY